MLNRKRILVLLIFLAIATVVVGFVSSAGKKQTTGTVNLTAGRKLADQFLSHVVKGDGEAAYKLLTPSVQSSVVKSDWVGRINELKGFYSKSEFKAQTTSNTGITTFTYQMTGKDGMYIFYVSDQIDDSGHYTVLSFSGVAGIYAAQGAKQ